MNTVYTDLYLVNKLFITLFIYYTNFIEILFYVYDQIHTRPFTAIKRTFTESCPDPRFGESQTLPSRISSDSGASQPIFGRLCLKLFPEIIGTDVEYSYVKSYCIQSGSLPLHQRLYFCGLTLLSNEFIVRMCLTS